MAISEFEIKRIEKFVGNFIEDIRPPQAVRHEMDISYEIIDQSFIIYEVRPMFGNPDEKIKTPVAKATWVKSRKIWKLFWMRVDGKWHTYPPYPETDKIENVLQAIKDDKNGCFWG